MYMEIELCYILEEAKFLELSNQFFYVRVLMQLLFSTQSLNYATA